MDQIMLRSQITAIQSFFNDDQILQIEVTCDDVKVYVKKGMGRERIDTGFGFEMNLLAARDKVNEPQQG